MTRIEYLRKEIKNTRKRFLIFLGVAVLIIATTIFTVFKIDPRLLIFLLPLSVLSIFITVDRYEDYNEAWSKYSQFCWEEQKKFYKNYWEDAYRQYKFGGRNYTNNSSQQRQQNNNSQQYQQSPPQQHSYTIDESFAFLGIKPGATPAEAKRAFRIMALKYHPDHGGSEEKFKLLIYHRDKVYAYLGIK